MNTSTSTTKKIDKKILLSTLWIVVMFNMLAADILSLYIPGALDELTKFAGETPIPLLMLVMAIPMELAIVMIILSRVLNYRVNRWVNIIMGVINFVYIWAAGGQYPHYTFIATIESICLLFIIWNAWKWTEEDT
jgi:Family of unknown function (DUF6326)